MSTESRGSAADPGPSTLVCPACDRRYSTEARFCGVCSMPLVHADVESPEPARSEGHERARKIRPEFARGELVRVAGGRNQAEAELIQNLLLEEGVPSMLRRSAGFDVPDFLAAGPRDVMVPESGAPTARDLLVETDMAPTAEAGGPTGRHTVVLLGAIVAGGLVTALIAWMLLPGA